MYMDTNCPKSPLPLRGTYFTWIYDWKTVWGVEMNRLNC